MHYIIEFFIPLLYFLLANATMVFITKKTFGKCLPLTLMASSFAIFFSQVIFQTFNVGIIVNILFALSSILIYILLYDKKKELFDELIKKNFTKGFMAFITIYILVFIYDLNRTYSDWDEFMHWGVMLKEMLRLDKFYSIAESTQMMHKNYPPIMQLFELFYIKLSGGYSEAAAIKAMHLFEFLLFIPAISELSFKKKSIIKNIVMIVMLFFIVLFNLLFWDVYHITNTILIDQILGILIAYIVFFIITEKNLKTYFSLINLCLALSFLIMLKQIAIIFYALMLFAIIFKYIIENRKNTIINKDKIIKLISIILLLVVIPLLFYFGWKLYVNSIGVPKYFSESKIDVGQLLDIIKGNSGEEYQKETANNFLNALINTSLSTSYLKINYILAIIIGLVLLFIIYKISKDKLYKNNIIVLYITLLLGAIGYAFVLMNSYIFLFGSYEGPMLAAYERYTSTYVILIFSLDIMLYFWQMSRIDLKEENKKILISAIIVIVCLLVQNGYTLFYMKPAIKTYYLPTYKDSQYIISKTNETDKIFIITQYPRMGELYQIKYYANPREVNRDTENWPLDGQLNEKIKNDLNNSNYLYLYFINDKFIEAYKDMFVDNNIKKKGLYKILKQDNKFRFELVE